MNDQQAPLLPQDIECEMRVLSGCMISAADHVIANVIPILKPEHFFRHDHRLIYQCFLEIYRDDKTCMTDVLRDRLKAKGELETVGGAAYIGAIFNSQCSAANIEYFAENVRDRAILRNLIRVSGEIQNQAFDPGTKPADLIEQAEKTFLHASSDLHTSQTVNIKETTPQVVSEILQRKGSLARPAYRIYQARSKITWAKRRRLDRGGRSNEHRQNLMGLESGRIPGGR